MKQIIGTFCILFLDDKLFSSSMETLTGPQFDVALELFPDLMEDIRLNDPNNGIKAEELL